ncbi:DUF4293 domain-containing protein [Arcticibacter svalbardensis]|nr:DUF4293 domain-containing protein [Arcticibacter svalbardensis]
MLQRIQTLWLFLSTTMIFALFLFPYLQIFNAMGTPKVIKVTGVFENVGGQIVKTDDFTLITIVTVLLALLPFVTIFLYKERKRQITLGYITIALIVAYSFWLASTAQQVLGDLRLQFQNYGLGIIFLPLSIFFIIMAIKGIRSDIRLLKSAERLR